VAGTLVDAVATVEIQRPPNNLLDLELLRALATAFAALYDDAKCRALVLAAVLPAAGEGEGEENPLLVLVLVTLLALSFFTP